MGWVNLSLLHARAELETAAAELRAQEVELKLQQSAYDAAKTNHERVERVVNALEQLIPELAQPPVPL